MPQENKGDLIEIGVLWKNERGTLTGKLGNARCLILPNKFKESPGQPDFRILVAKDDRRNGDGDHRSGGGSREQSGQQERLPPPDDSDIPF